MDSEDSSKDKAPEAGSSREVPELTRDRSLLGWAVLRWFQAGAFVENQANGRGAANAAAVVVVRNVQPLMQAIFDATEATPVEFQPLLRIEFLWLGAGQQRDVFVLAALGLAEQSGRLRRQRALLGRLAPAGHPHGHRPGAAVIPRVVGNESHARRLEAAEAPARNGPASRFDDCDAPQQVRSGHRSQIGAIQQNQVQRVPIVVGALHAID